MHRIPRSTPWAHKTHETRHITAMSRGAFTALIGSMLLLALMMAGCSGGNQCTRACKAMEKCAEQGETAQPCTLGATCDPADECRATCILAGSCAAYSGSDPGQAQVLQSCMAGCAAGTVPDGGETDGGVADQGLLGDQSQEGDQGDPMVDSGTQPDSCQPACGDRECGDNGCGGSCGTCSGPEVCNTAQGQCVSSCTPSCAGKECGDDGCGGSCGTCSGLDVCKLGQCVCEPDCWGKECGNDGCGGTCGTCPAQHICSSGGCVCQPACSGKECGDDGCGGTCGDCLSFQTCGTSGSCVKGTSCGLLTNEGCCLGEMLYYCNVSTVGSINCVNNPSCGWASSASIYDCGTSGGADPSGLHPKTCQ